MQLGDQVHCDFTAIGYYHALAKDTSNTSFQEKGREGLIYGLPRGDR